MALILPIVIGLLVAILGLVVLKVRWARRTFIRYVLQGGTTPAQELAAGIVTSLIASELVFAGVYIALPTGLWLDVILAIGVVISFFSFQYAYKRICDLAKDPAFQLRVLEILKRTRFEVASRDEDARRRVDEEDRRSRAFYRDDVIDAIETVEHEINKTKPAAEQATKT